MRNKPIYLDNAATTRPDPQVIEAMREALAEHWGNPSSAHELGSDAKMRLEEARAAIARALGLRSRRSLFHLGRHRSRQLGAAGRAGLLAWPEARI